MANTAILGQGVKFSVGEGAATLEFNTDQYLTLCNLTGLEPVGATTDQIEVTTLGSTEKEFISGLTNNGTWTFTGNWLPGLDAQQRMEELLSTRKTANFKLEFPDDGYGNGPVFWFCKANVLSYNPSIQAGEAITVSGSIQLTGAIVKEVP